MITGTVRDRFLSSPRVASPSMTGISMSSTTTSGSQRSKTSSPSSPFAAHSHSMSSCSSKIVLAMRRTTIESSTTRTLSEAVSPSVSTGALADADSRPSIEILSSRASRVNGFIRYSFAPASSALETRSMPVSVDTIMILDSSNAPRSRTARTNSMPFMTGMFQSTSIRSGRSISSSRASASCPSPAS